MQLPRADIITCKHCGKPIALIPRPAIVARFKLTCQFCKVIFSVYPEQQGEVETTMPRLERAPA